MKPPSRITVVGHEYRLAPSLKPDLGVGDGTELAGHWDGSSSLITLAQSLSASVMRETVLHEVLHALARYTNTAGLNERTISQVCPSLLDTLRRNRKLTEFLLARD